MNAYLLQLASNFISLLVVSFLSLFGGEQIFNRENMNVSTNYEDKTLSVVNTIINYDTEIVYNRKVPYNISKVLVEGKNGISYENDLGEAKILAEPVTEVIEKGTGSYGEFTGIMTGYGPDCKTCNGIGYVACRTKEGKNFNLINDGVYYEDSEFGKVRVLAAAHSVFPCGTIVYVDNNRLEPFYGIVLDTGWGMNNSLSQDIIHFDMAFATEKDPEVYNATSKNVKYSVQRWGF